jgi:hypothetical protein
MPPTRLVLASPGKSSCYSRHHNSNPLPQSYVSDAIYNIKRFVTETHGEHGKAELNSVCTAHTMTLMAGTGFTYNGCRVEEGQLRLIFSPTYLGTNISQAAQELDKAITAAPQPAGAPSLSFAARHSIKEDYDPKIGDLLEKARKALENPKLEFQPDFNDIGKMMKGAKDIRDDWERNMGNFTYQYFESFVDRLAYEKFEEDDMLREGFAEGVPSNIVKFRIVAKMDGYNAILLDDGAVVLQVCGIL